jgi:hypothetical protein
MALVFWLYVACIILLLGAELAYAIAKERRGIGPREEMQVVAPEGEQPTPKFAPQVGAGISDPERREPIMAHPTTATDNSPTPPSNGSSHHGNRPFSNGRRSSTNSGDRSRNGSPLSTNGHMPSSNGSRSMRDGSARSTDGARSSITHGAVKKLIWTGLSAATLALTGVLAHGSTTKAWQAATGEAPPPDKD